MRTRTGILTVSLIAAVTLAACGKGGESADAGDPASDDAFAPRAAQVAEVWRTLPPTGVWNTGFVPLGGLTLKPATGPDGQPLDEATLTALNAGFLILDTSLPKESADQGEITFPDGTPMTVGLVGAKQAWQDLAPADPADCTNTPDDPAPDGSGGPDDTTSHKVPCSTLRVTDAELGSVPLQTSRGAADVPAWLFTVEGLSEPIARVAVSPEDIDEVPRLDVPDPGDMTGLVSAQDLVSVEGDTVTYRLGVGACDIDVKALFLETDSAVVVAGSAETTGDTCIDMLKYEPVTITLSKPLGSRPLVSAHTGQPVKGAMF
ncbi:hypothetical protein [Phytomonospora endophytica]|uniref:Lipoprotein n=1 Tax=Phytomonospora endophytica TaxID=714109 RepID=A0A841FJ92_9ACTN|nr:hypothetical protein [Phytomonospora endophytica]MBB6035885.1 hypothetical protein [Phytomonospora endophytica]GIG71119.1 hypothetical protein Pen01_74140 [Phytomonospora endophytica]